MKLKNIATAGVAAFMILTACTDEYPDQPNQTAGDLPVSVNLTFTTGEVMTKAPAESYTHATEEEIRINNVAIAIYKVNADNSTGALLGFKYTEEEELEEVTCTDEAHSDRPGYKVTGIPAETGKVRILAIANSGSTEEELQEASGAYGTFKALSENFLDKVGPDPFCGCNADDLVKFKELETTLSVESYSVHIELIQLAARIDVSLNIINALPEGVWTFTMAGHRVSGINATSDVFLGDDLSTVVNENINVVPGNVPVGAGNITINSADNGASNPKYAFSFYTYEKPTGDVPIVIGIAGKLQDAGQDPENENKTYNIVLNPVKEEGNPLKQTDGIVHGNVYKVTGSFDAKMKTIGFDYAVIPWQGERLTDVNIKPIYYLLVKDRQMTMPNTTSVQTQFESSSPVEIIDLKTFVVGESGDVQDAAPQATVTPSASNNGTVTVGSDLPVNFVPRKITFTVKNANGLTQDVEIMQYPPLYITFEKSGSTGSGSQGQTNYNYYKFTSLIADYTLFPYPDEFNESRPNGTMYDPDETAGRSYTDYIRGNAVLGFPQMSGTGNTAYTIDSEDNNRMISPNFMLASQAGITNTASYTDRRNRCRDYTEVRVVNGQRVTLSDWRMPTLAELYVIDVLQNVEGCVVKRILEGQYYWSSRSSQTVKFMDPRVINGGNSTNGAVRCVRDIKE